MKKKGQPLEQPLVCVGLGLLILPELTDFEHAYDDQDEIVPVSYANPGKIEKRGITTMKAFEYAGSLMKVGKRTKKWISRWHVLKNYTMYIYGSKSSSVPKRKQIFSKLTHLSRYNIPQRHLLWVV